MIGSDLKAHLYYQLLHHVESMEKLREKHKINTVDFDQILTGMKEEYRKERITEDQVRLAAYSKISALEQARL